MGSVSALGVLACAGAIGGFAIVEARADPFVCQDLRAQYVSLFRQSGAGVSNIEALTRQLWQAQAAARSGNCNRFLFFGPPRSPACPAITATIGSLRRQLAGARGQGSFGFAASSDFVRARLRDALIQNGCGIPATVASGRTLCVRTCDGYYFPISNMAGRSRAKIDDAVCQSMYSEEGQAELYVQPPGADVDQAVSPNGMRYVDQPYAFQYRQSYDQSCHAELKTGISALAERYLNAPPMGKEGKVAVSMSALDAPLAVEDLNTTETEIAEVVEVPSAPEPDQAKTPPDPRRPVRFVGDAFYVELFDLSRPARPVRIRRLTSVATTHPRSRADE